MSEKFDKCVEKCVDEYKYCYEADANLCLTEAYNYCLSVCDPITGERVDDTDADMYYDVDDCIDDCISECGSFDPDCVDYCDEHCASEYGDEW